MSARLFDGVPSVPQPTALRPDLVLIALPPRDRVTRDALIVLPKDEDHVDRVGLVAQVGARVQDVQPGDRVVFDTLAAEELRVNDWPCVLVTETAIEAVVED